MLPILRAVIRWRNLPLELAGIQFDGQKSVVLLEVFRDFTRIPRPPAPHRWRRNGDVVDGIYELAVRAHAADQRVAEPHVLWTRLDVHLTPLLVQQPPHGVVAHHVV